MIQQTFTEKPSVLKNSMRLLMHRPKFHAHAPLPEVELRLALDCIDLAKLHDYQNLCAYAISDQVPLCFPYVLCGPLHLQLLTSLPIPAMGLLHLRSQINLIDAIDPLSPCELICRSGKSQLTPQGFEFEAISILEQGGKIRWSCTATFLRRGSFSEASDYQAYELNKLDFANPIGNFAVPGNIGRRYARMCGDFNPIHISSPSAWIFGLKGSIAHGMWVAARALPLLNKAPTSMELAFKGPVFTGGYVELMQKDLDFNLYYRGNPRPVILGRLS